ncbi:MAG: hypothetical protein PUH03_00420, partial [bacterium]|nr:hypothetical protein [bacterium]MDY2830333.1 hypothetical protein [Alphaproteobacteria bacterium]
NSLLSFPNTTQKPRFYTLKEEQKSPFYSPFNLLSFLSVSICFGKLYRVFISVAFVYKTGAKLGK